MIEAPPRHGKSEIASRRFPAWYLGRNPERQIISASYNDLLATDIGRDVRNIVRGRDYQNVFPGIELAEDSAAAGRWHTNKGGAYLATGVGGTMTGYGAHVLSIDDPHKNREEADSQRIRDNIWNWYTSTAVTRLMPGGAIVMMLTRWHEDDLAARALDSEEWVVVKLPAIFDEGTSEERALWPEWYPLEALHERRKVLPPRDWAALYQQEPRAEQGTYIQRAWFDDRYDAPPGMVNVYMASDFAVAEPREGRDPDYTEHGVFGLGADDMLYVLDWWHGQTTPDVWIEELVRLVKMWKPIAWFGEGGVIRHAIEPFLVRRMRETKTYTRTEWLNPIRDKATHGRAFQARAAMGRVRLPRTLWAERIVSQWVGFPGGTHDDAFDAIGKMCRALDEAHPATGGARPPKPTPRDYGDKASPVKTYRVV
jgi:predicted phage terminase large subunit-like protein